MSTSEKDPNAGSGSDTTSKLTVLLDTQGRVVGAFRQGDSRPTSSTDEVVSVGVIAQFGQSLVDIELQEDLANVDAQELLTRLAANPSVQQAIANMTFAGQATTGMAYGAAISAGPASDFPLNQPAPFSALGSGGTRAGTSSSPLHGFGAVSARQELPSFGQPFGSPIVAAGRLG